MNEPKKYRKKAEKTEIVEALQFTGENWADVDKLAAPSCFITIDRLKKPQFVLKVNTQLGLVRCDTSEYVVKDAKGNFLVCAPDFFEKTYELAEKDLCGWCSDGELTFNKQRSDDDWDRFVPCRFCPVCGRKIKEES